MKLVYTSANSLLVAHVRNLIEAEGIGCRMRNEFLAGAAGELPPTECWPEVWVEEADAVRAEAVVAAAMSADVDAGPPWRCAECGEENEGQFGLCWRCGALRP